ncbi:MAG: fibronectin type III domain-containing protein, partial [Clostridia bacterium]|nr:fibronectin type III domain-containing protein [Clostridia bacterium]
DASRVAYPTSECVSNSEYTNSSFATSRGWYWWLRTPHSSNARSVRGVSTDGTLNYYSAFNGHRGVRPLCNLSSSILVSDTTNSDGNYEIIYNTAPSAPSGITAPAQAYSGQNIEVSCAEASDPDGDALTYCFERSYNSGAWTQVQSSAARTFTEAVSTAWNTLKYRVRAKDSAGNYSAYITSGDIAVIHNQPPVISGANADLGVKRAGFTYEYSVTDPDADVVNVVERIDGAVHATKNNVELGETQTLSVIDDSFTALSNAIHTITITATDSAGNSAVRTLTFTKAIDGFVITLTEPLEAESQPTRCNITVTRDIPAGGEFKVEATNNPFDTSPVWEDCTNAVISGHAHVFENTMNTAAQYGLNIRVTVKRGTALTNCWVSGIGGNFE